MSSEFGDDAFTIVDEVEEDLNVSFEENDVKSNSEVEDKVEGSDHVRSSGEGGSECGSVKSEQGETETNETSGNLNEEQGNDEDNERDNHPYQYLIDTFKEPIHLMSPSPVNTVKHLNQTPVHMVVNREMIMKMVHTLRTAKEIALDCSTSNKQVLCLLEISTKDVDYVIDAANIRKDILLLTEIFINPNIVKIINNMDRVLVYLQKYLHLYPVNIFDVNVAIEAYEGSPARTVLVVLAEEYKIVRDPEFYSKGLRQKPLPKPVQDFCRTVPHYMIHIYHDYKNKLLSKDPDLYKGLLKRFRDASKFVHKGPFAPVARFDTMEKELLNRHRCQKHLLPKLHYWRERVAKKLNKQRNHVVPQSRLLQLVRQLSTDDYNICTMASSGYIRHDMETVKALIRESMLLFNVSEPKYVKPNKKGFHNKFKQQDGNVSAAPSKPFTSINDSKRKNISFDQNNSGENKKPKRYFDNTEGNTTEWRELKAIVK